MSYLRGDRKEAQQKPQEETAQQDATWCAALFLAKQDAMMCSIFQSIRSP